MAGGLCLVLRNRAAGPNLIRTARKNDAPGRSQVFGFGSLAKSNFSSYHGSVGLNLSSFVHPVATSKQILGAYASSEIVRCIHPGPRIRISEKLRSKPGEVSV